MRGVEAVQTIYEPKGKAKEYADLALNIYEGCSHGCKYCSVPLILKKNRVDFHACVKPRANILEETRARCIPHASGGVSVSGWRYQRQGNLSLFFV